MCHCIQNFSLNRDEKHLIKHRKHRKRPNFYLLFCCRRSEVSRHPSSPLYVPAAWPPEAAAGRRCRSCRSWSPPPAGSRTELDLCRWWTLEATAGFSSGSFWVWLDDSAEQRCARSPEGGNVGKSEALMGGTVFRMSFRLHGLKNMVLVSVNLSEIFDFGCSGSLCLRMMFWMCSLVQTLGLINNWWKLKIWIQLITWDFFY